MTFPFAGLYSDNLVTATGQLSPNMAVTVYLHGTLTLATLYTDRTKATPVANPTATDSRGNLAFYADPGLYDISNGASSVTVAVVPDSGDLGGGGAIGLSNTVVSAGAFGRTSTAGTSVTASRGDHDHGTPSVSPLVLPDTATPGAAPVGGLDLYSHSQNSQSTLRALLPENVEVDVFRDMLFIARNNTASIIPIGTPVYVSDVFTGGEIAPVVSPAQANAQATLAFGVTWEAIPVNGFGRVMIKGRIFNLNTVAFAVNSWLYLSAATPGGLTVTQPAPPNLTQPVAYVLRSHASQGELLVTTNAANGYALGTNQNSFQIGNGAAGTKTLVFTNGQTMTLSATPTGARVLTLPDVTGTVHTTGNAPVAPPPFSVPGTVAVATGTATWYNDTGRTLTFVGARSSVGTAPTGASLIVDIKVNGTSLWSVTPANRPTIAAAAKTSGNVTTFDNATITNGSFVTVDVVQVGSGTPGSDLTVQFELVG